MIEYWTEEQMKEKLNEAVARLGVEKQLTFFTGKVFSKDQWGTAYNRLIQGVLAPEGTVGRGFTWVGPEVLKDFIKNFRRHLKGVKTVVWREPPTLICEVVGPELTVPGHGKHQLRVCYIYCRLSTYADDRTPDA